MDESPDPDLIRKLVREWFETYNPLNHFTDKFTEEFVRERMSEKCIITPFNGSSFDYFETTMPTWLKDIKKRPSMDISDNGLNITTEIIETIVEKDTAICIAKGSVGDTKYKAWIRIKFIFEDNKWKISLFEPQLDTLKVAKALDWLVIPQDKRKMIDDYIKKLKEEGYWV